jgi:hypothetical protein
MSGNGCSRPYIRQSSEIKVYVSAEGFRRGQCVAQCMLSWMVIAGKDDDDDAICGRVGVVWSFSVSVSRKK